MAETLAADETPIVRSLEGDLLRQVSVQLEAT